MKEENSTPYEDYLKMHRIMLETPINHLSGGLQPKVIIMDSFNGDTKSQQDLITFTSKHYTNGGTYLWHQVGHWKSPYTGNELPIFDEPILVKPSEVHGIYPVQNSNELYIQYDKGFFSILKRIGSNQFETDEYLSEKYGMGLINVNFGQLRAAKMELHDITKNGFLDLIVGTNNWDEYFPTTNKNGKMIRARWGDQGYHPFDENNKWIGGPLIGQVFVIENLGEDPEDPDAFLFKEPKLIPEINQYGFCTPVIADFTGDGLEDIICGDFLDNITFYKRLPNDENFATNSIRFAQGVPLLSQKGEIIKSHGVINYLSGTDITGNGKIDIVFGTENGYISVLENLGNLSTDGIPLFTKPIYLIQNQAPAKADVLAVPAIAPLRGTGLDLIAGTAAGYFYHFENLEQETLKLKWHVPNIPRILPNDLEAGSIQGPSEIGWGYTAPTLFDWTQNGRFDLIFSDINGEHQICLNSGTSTEPHFEKPQKILDADILKPLTTVWRVKPALYKAENEEIRYLCLNENAILTQYIKVGDFLLKKQNSIKTEFGSEITFTNRFGGSQGRVKLHLFDWNNNGKLDLIVGLQGGHNFSLITNFESYKPFPHASVVIFENQGTNQEIILSNPKYFKLKTTGEIINTGHHSCAAEAYSWEKQTFLIIGCEDGQLYRFKKEELTF